MSRCPTPPDHTGPEAVAGLAKRRAKRGEPIMLRMRFDGAAFTQAVRRLDRGLRALERERRRKLVEAARVLRGLPPVPGWIDEDPPSFEFPYWAPRWRPFDWADDFGEWRDTTITAQIIEAARITAPVIRADASVVAAIRA